MYQALYRKWRPKTFSQVVGQDHITGTLQRQVAEGRTAHAYLFTGTRGTGKTTCARILAKAVNCLHPEDGAPCNQCEACRGIDSGSLLDVTELDAASNSRVDDIRELLSESVYTPTVLKKRVYIIDEVHMLSTQAFNALLKTIEEPPEHLMFILATTELHKVPATILSRCQRFTFKRILPRDMEKHLLGIAQAEQIDLTPDGAEILARMANGALRDALSLLDQCRVAQGQLDSRAVLDILGLAGSVQTVELMDCILRRDAAGALTRLDGLYRGGKDVAAMLGELGDLARDMTILKAAPDGAAALLTGIYDTKTLKSLSGSQPMRRFLYLTETLQSCCAGLGDSFRPRTDAELCLLRLCDESLSGDLTALSQRIDRLEDQVANGIPVKTVPQTAGTSPKTAPLSRDSAGTSRDVPSDDRPPMPEEPPLPEEPGGRERVYDIPDEEPPAARPAARPVRKPVAAKSTAVVGDTGKWDAMKEHCKGRLAVNHRVFLNMVQGAVDGDCLTLYCQNEFVRDSLNNNTVLHVLQEVASAAEGQTIRVALTVGGAPAGKKTAKPRPKPEKVTEKAPEKPPEKAPEPEQTPPWEEPPAEKAPDKLDEVAAQGRQLENFKIK
jgi:DNA polymerase-3 subunit gamma/tau